MHLNQKKSIVNTMKEVFGVETVQDLSELYHKKLEITNPVSQRTEFRYFESEVISELLNKIGLERKYFFEHCVKEANKLERFEPQFNLADHVQDSSSKLILMRNLPRAIVSIKP